ncbi:DUF4304 domain-containing protein [Campylobacter sp. Marseille-Q3452]|uniref:DUF4304 domain-containing protein n=1 Tax=Campylobacter massiliensis TaxID=2762557 RepID=A0A842J6Y3_9BACT|nr:DUF4304 domain-containing protein [Campylobacter massiliensis]MBC2881902.1 DUF4304 domain-containing protein [Campylobacter massiliensis]
MKAKFDELIAQVKPLFKDNGFTKNGLNFYKNTPEFIYVVNFQKSSGNTASETRFYVNCGIYGAFIDAATGKEFISKPKEYECHFRDRISSIIDSKTAYYEINENTYTAALCENLASDLRAIFSFFEEIKTERNLIDLMLERNGLAVIDQLFEYLLIKREQEILIRQALNLFQKYGNETRWKIFERRINDLLKNMKKTR